MTFNNSNYTSGGESLRRTIPETVRGGMTGYIHRRKIFCKLFLLL